MPNSKQIVYLSQSQYAELIANGSITVDGVTVQYDENDIYVTPQAEPVTDVQINGTSILNNGTANIPLATNSNIGVVKVSAGSDGVAIAPNGGIYVSRATDAQIKAGTDNFKPIVSSNQHQAAFYGLAKAAGTDEKDSTLTVGQYTNTAKTAIRSMIGATSSNVIAVQDTQPTDADTKIWLPETAGTPVDIPTVAEMNAALAGKVGDVQVNGTSVVTNGVASVPVASADNAGVVKFNNNLGLGVNNSGEIYVYRATDANIKGGATGYRPIVSQVQHMSTFYGLAKAAGDTTQSQSNNTIGTYTEEAKIAIQKMLGIYEAPWELINSGEFTNETEADYIIETDSLGQSFKLTDVIIMFETPKQDTTASFGGSGAIKVYPSANNETLGYFSIECYGYTQQPNASPHGCNATIFQNKNMLMVYRMSAATNSNTGAVGQRYGERFSIDNYGDRVQFRLLNNPVTFYRVKIDKVTGTGQYWLYGKRQWTT